jgi:sugar fermentation stimulation protein A
MNEFEVLLLMFIFVVQAACVYLIQRSDCSSFAPCHARDPEYGLAVLKAQRVGVDLIALVCDLDPVAGTIRYLKPVPVCLQHGLCAP